MKQGRSLLILAAFAALAVVGQSQDWKQIGPAPINLGFSNATSSGIINDIAIDPTGSTDSTIYVATGAGGIWKTINGGSSWNPLTDLLPANQMMGAVALDPGNPLIVYAGVGGNYCCPEGGGIYESPDGGNTWQVLNPNGIFTGVQINRIVLPAPGSLLVATGSGHGYSMTCCGLYKSIDGGNSFGNNAPTFNNGSPISITTPGGSVSQVLISDLQLDTATPTTIYAAVDGVGIFRSTDAGATFPASGAILSSANFPTSINGDVFIKIAQSTQPDNMTMYAFLCVYATQCALLKSISGEPFYGSVSFDEVPLAGCVINNNQGNYDQTIGVDPQDATKVYVGLRPLYFSGDGGNSCHQIINTTINVPHTDMHAIAFSPASHFAGPPPTRVFIGDDGGFQSTASEGSQWQYLNNGLATILLYDMDMGRGSSAHNAYVYGAAQDNGLSAKTSGQSGTDIWGITAAGWGGDGCGVAVDPSNPGYMVGNLDGGFVSLGWPGPSALPANSPPVCLVSFNPGGGVAYAVGGSQLFQGSTNGTTFSLMYTFPQTVTAMNQVKGVPNTIWVGLGDGTVAYTNNALQGSSATWTAQTVNGAPPNRRVSGIAIDPVNISTVVAVYPGFSADVTPPQHAFLTTNNGSYWSNISGTANGGDNNLPDLPLHAVVIVPTTSPETIVVGSDVGVMQSADFGQTWQVLGTGFPTVSVNALAFDPPLVLRAGTFGRSVFEFCPLCPPVPPTVTISANNTSISPGETSTLTWYSTNATSCVASDAWPGTNPAIGAGTSPPGDLSNTAGLTVKPTFTPNVFQSFDTYPITCTGLGGSATAAVTVTVFGPYQKQWCGGWWGGGPCVCLRCVFGPLRGGGGHLNLGEFGPFGQIQPGTFGPVLVLLSGTVEAVSVEHERRGKFWGGGNEITTITISPGSKVVTSGELGNKVRIVEASVDSSKLLSRLPTGACASLSSALLAVDHPNDKPKIVGVALRNGKVAGLLVAGDDQPLATPPAK